MFKLSARSESRLMGVHPALQSLVRRALALSTVDFAVLEGIRTPERQAELMKAGASQTLKSRHLTGHAVDLGAIVAGEVRWDWPLYDQIAKAMKQAASELGTPLEWGGGWQSLKDGPHFQLPWKEFP